MSYRDLESYKLSTIIYDFTVEFCKCYIDYKSRTKDQMEQAARSGKQNIVEGSMQRASDKGEIKLLAVARASLQELLEDYEDYLRQHEYSLWDKNSQEAKEVRGLAYKTDKSYTTYKSYMERPDIAAKTMICVIHQANFLLDRQIRVLEEKFITEGGYSENLYKRRIEYRMGKK